MNKRGAAVALAVCAVISFSASEGLAQYRPELVGEWKGVLEHGARVVPTDQTPTYLSALDPKQPVNMTIIGQDDRSFHGTLGNAEERDYVVGVIAADGKTLHMADNGGLKTATMPTPTTMEYCVQVASGDHFVAACGVLEKQGE
ncbi:MAG: hypothetical protein AAF724_21420 [Pseudomonadota bacterium]